MKQAFISILTIAILCSFTDPNKINIQNDTKTVNDNVPFNLYAASNTYGSVEFINQDTYADNTYYWDIASYGLQISIPTGNYEVLVNVNDSENDSFHSVTFADSTQSADMPGLFYCDWDLVAITDTDNTWMSVQ